MSKLGLGRWYSSPRKESISISGLNGGLHSELDCVVLGPGDEHNDCCDDSALEVDGHQHMQLSRSSQ